MAEEKPRTNSSYSGLDPELHKKLSPVEVRDFIRSIEHERNRQIGLSLLCLLRAIYIRLFGLVRR